MSTLIVIPARLGSTRLPQKPLQLLGGRPLIVRVWERVTALGLADAIVVATDAADVEFAAREGGAEVVMTRPDHASGTDRVAEVARLPAYSHHEVVVNVQGDEPFIAAEAIRGARDLVSSGAFDIGTAAQPASPAVLGDPAVVKVVADDSGRALYFSRAPIPFLRDPVNASALTNSVRAHIGVYAYARAALQRWGSLPPHPLEVVEQLEQLRALAAGLTIGVTTVAPAPTQGIDTAQDLVAANLRWLHEHTLTPAGAS